MRVILLLAALLATGGGAHAACNVIPSATGQFRAAQGQPLRPFAAPGEDVVLRLPPSCNTSTFLPTAAAHTVTVVFTPPNVGAARNVVAISTDCTALESARDACEDRPDVATATCVEVDPTGDPGSLAVFTVSPSTER